jgi:hypothetical protein
VARKQKNWPPLFYTLVFPFISFPPNFGTPVQ